MTNVKLATLLGAQNDRWLITFYSFEPSALNAFISGTWEAFFKYSTGSSYNRVLWTMKPELYGSFFVFAYLALLGKHHARWIFYLITFIVIYKLSKHSLNAFLMGTMLCDIFVNQKTILQRFPERIKIACQWFIHNKWVALTAVFPIMYLIGLPNRGVFHLFLSSALIFYVTLSIPVGKFFSHKIPLFLGKISFGLYLAHLPVICSTAFPVYKFMTSYTAHTTAAVMAYIIVAILSIIADWCLWFSGSRSNAVY